MFYEKEIEAFQASAEKLRAKMQKISDGAKRMNALDAWIRFERNPGEALCNWRNDVCKRVQPSTQRPLLIRIPKIFMDELKLTLQRVQLQADGSVLEVLEYNRTKTKLNVKTGRVIVPPAEKETYSSLRYGNVY